MMDNFNKRYKYIIVDSVNFAYRVFKNKQELPLQVGKKSVYRESICKFINSIEDLKSKYLSSDGDIYLLFDNYFSKADLRSTYMFADRKSLDESYKATRKKESKEFYNSLNFLRYYYLIGPSNYHTIRIDNLEADDLVEPLFNKLDLFNNPQTTLLITTDFDWARYIQYNVDWLPDLSKNPEDFNELSYRMGFPITKLNVILYKAIFGDKSDNITGLITLNDSMLQEFNDLIKTVEYPEKLIEYSRDKEMVDKYKIIDRIAKDEKSLLVNLQLVSSIPCSVSTLNCSLTNGRNASTLYNTVREAIGLDDPQGFVFGNVKRTRIS